MRKTKLTDDELQAEALANLKLVRSKPIEQAHAAADGILCEMLSMLGFDAVVDEYVKFG